MRQGTIIILIFMKKYSCSLVLLQRLFAFVEFANSDSALKALHHPYPLFLYAKRLVLKPRESTASKKKMAAAAKESAKVQTRDNPPDKSPSVSIPAALGGILFPPGTVEELELANTVS